MSLLTISVTVTQNYLHSVVRFKRQYKNNGDGVWTATQTDLGTKPPPIGTPNRRIDFDWGIGPIKVTGYVDLDSFQASLTLEVAGINLGTISGDLKKGIKLNFETFVASGWVRFYIKNGNELWVEYHVKIIFDGTFDGDHKIITLPIGDD
ncbi:hypothetical protein F4810DRAFT_714455 [Camillea tinctor]|nr:hypothetical protein F4810DRAFT_714455 [Camillea tinctor]